MRPIATIASVLDIITVIASLICLTSLTVYGGFDHKPEDTRLLFHILRGCHILFLINVLYNLILNSRQTLRQTRIIKWIVDAAMLISLLPLIYPHPLHPWIPFLEKVLYSRSFIIPVLAAYAAMELSYGTIAAIGKKTNPSLLLSASFLFLILVGSLLLMMPKCTTAGISYIDALFISTSAVCITGLTPVEISNTLTPTGLLILAILIQTGGLGVMTFTSFFAIFFSGNTSIYSQLMVKDMVYSKTFNALIPTLLYILGFTIAVEAAGAVAIYLSINNTLALSTEDKIVFSAFHSLSAFCNAGFSNIEGGLSNPALLHSNQCVYLVISILVAAGGIGFPILVNFKTAAARYLKKIWDFFSPRPNHHYAAHIYDLNTKIVVYTTSIIFIASSGLFLLFEYDNSLAGMSIYDKIAQSIFNSWVPRSSGFSSVNPSGFMNITILMFIILMWIGGASQSTAGGIKVNTFAIMILNLKAVIQGKESVTAFRRAISVPSLKRAHAVIAISVVTYALYSMILIWLEPQLSAKALLYEAASALFTVGTSLGITPMLDSSSKILLCTAMFLGRVGIISLLAGIVRTHIDTSARFPSDYIIIN
ncbi:MAG: potassium transporter [Bacteroidales bacterium]|nr:potassium transporter [Bacteroidales bacterium]